MKRIIYLAFNMNSEDNSGLPTYSKSFLLNMEGSFDLLTINVISSPTEKDRIDCKDDKQYDIYLSNFFNSFSMDLNGKIKTLFKEFNPDIVLVQDYLFEPYMEQFYGRQAFKKVFFVHLCQRGLYNTFTKQPFFDIYMEQGMMDLSRKCWLEWKSIMTSDIVITNSDFSKREIEKYYSEYQKSVISIPLGVNLDIFNFSPAMDNKQWMYFGRLDMQKGIPWIIKDFVDNPSLYKSNPLIVSGDGTMDNQIIKANFFDNFVSYRGNLKKPELIELLREVKYCIFPSIYEPYGLALNEALAMGKICVVNAVDSGMLEQLYDDENNINCFIVNFSKDSIIKIINHIETNVSAELLNKISNNAARLANDEKKHFLKLKEVLNLI